MEPNQLATFIDHTLLRPEATPADLIQLCDEAKLYRFHAICVNSANLSICKPLLANSQVNLCATIGFPLGAMISNAKAKEAQEAVYQGANELDMVINIGALRAKNIDFVFQDIKSVVDASKGACVKVILEIHLLNRDEKKIACQLAMRAGASMVKTSSGFSGGGATPKDVQELKQLICPQMGIKASGGIRSKKQALALIEAGATRIGTSMGVKVVAGETI